jgi:hypothetical protein
MPQAAPDECKKNKKDEKKATERRPKNDVPNAAAWLFVLCVLCGIVALVSHGVSIALAHTVGWSATSADVCEQIDSIPLGSTTIASGGRLFATTCPCGRHETLGVCNPAWVWRVSLDLDRARALGYEGLSTIYDEMACTERAPAPSTCYYTAAFPSGITFAMDRAHLRHWSATVTETVFTVSIVIALLSFAGMMRVGARDA